MSFQSRMRYMNPYDMHKALINEYMLRRPGDTRAFNRDTSNDKRDIDVIKENHKFLWDEADVAETWEQQFARKYYDKLFKEYCIGDLSRFKENKIAMRWRTQQEVVVGKGQFICGNKHCLLKEDLRTWEVNFGYIEDGIKKNALVKIRLCPECSTKLNYTSQKREVKRLKRKRKSKRDSTPNRPSTSDAIECVGEKMSDDNKDQAKDSESPWENVKSTETKSRDEEMEEYLQDLLL